MKRHKNKLKSFWLEFELEVIWTLFEDQRGIKRRWNTN